MTAKFRQYNVDLAYKNYVAETLYLNAQGKMLTVRFCDIIGRKEQQKDTRSGDEIAMEVIQKAGLVFKEKS